jgi:hypothetical protein
VDALSRYPQAYAARGDDLVLPFNAGLIVVGVLAPQQDGENSAGVAATSRGGGEQRDPGGGSDGDPVEQGGSTGYESAVVNQGEHGGHRCDSSD